MEIRLACWRKPRRVWTSSFATAPISSGSRRGGRRAARTTSGTKRSTSASANAPTRCGSGRAVRKARRTSTGIGRAPLRRADASSMRKIEELAPPRVRSSGLWNQQHFEETHDPAFLDAVEELIGASGRANETHAPGVSSEAKLRVIEKSEEKSG